MIIDRKPWYVMRARAIRRAWHAVLALIVALGLTLWLGLFVAAIASALTISLTPRFWVPWNSFVVVAMWLALFLAIRRRRRF